MPTLPLKVTAIAVSLFAACASLLAGAQPRPELLVSSQWLAGHLNDPKVIILHVAEDRAGYDKQHIPGARFLAFRDFIVEHEGPMSELPPDDQLKQVFERLGVSNDTRVVVYTDDWFPYAARGYYTLDYLGHGHKTALLDGGLEQWKLERRALTADVPPVSRGKFTLRVRPGVRATLEEVRQIAAGDGAKALLLDSRPPQRYLNGHLSGARNLYWKETLVSEQSPVLLPADKLRGLLASRGLAPGHKLVTYCEVGIQASHGYWLAKYLGYDAAIYDGSYYEWKKLKALPVKQGESPQ